MLDRKYIREHPEDVKKAVATKGAVFDASAFITLDAKERDCKKQLEDIRGQKHRASKRIPSLPDKEKETLLKDLQALDKRAEQLAHEHEALLTKLATLLKNLPNVPLRDVKVGTDASANDVVREEGKKPAFSFPAKDYLMLAEAWDGIDMARAAKISGSRFGILKGRLAQLEFALIQYGLSVVAKEGFRAVVTPALVRAAVMDGMGYLALHGDRETYHLERDDLYLVGTAEQALGGMHQNEIFSAAELPHRYAGFSSAFRRESGSYGKDTKGILRVHQFDKLELFSFTTPEQSDAEHECILSLEERLMRGLGIAYRVVKMCTGDLGVQAARKYDLEAWMPGQGTYRETHSCSSCTDYQARGLNIRYKKPDGTRAYVHTLNGTAFAVGRTLIAIIENYQREDGSLVVPDVLQPFVGFSVISANS